MEQEIKIRIPEGTQFDSAEVNGNYLVTTFKEKKVSIEDLHTFEACCKFLGISTDLPDVSRISKKHGGYIQASYMLAIINEAWNKVDQFTPDYSNFNQKNGMLILTIKVLLLLSTNRATVIRLRIRGAVLAFALKARSMRLNLASSL